MSLGEGIHLGLIPEAYHADPAPVSLSSSILNLLLARSPLHAWTAHPRLNPDWRPQELDSTQQSARDFGSAVHALLLEGGVGEERICVVDEDSWRKQIAQEARAGAHAAGMIPMLRHKFAQAQEMCAAIHAQLAASEIAPMIGEYGVRGVPEATLVWTEDGVRCRMRADWLANTNDLILDLKTTSVSAHPQVVARQILNLGADVQALFYSRGVQVLTGIEPKFVFVVAEVDPPYATSLISLAPGWLEVARRKVEYGLGVWNQCMATGVWDGYPRRVSYPELPAWSEAAWTERELNNGRE